MLLEKENIKLILIQIVMSLRSVAWVSLFFSDLKEQFAVCHQYPSLWLLLICNVTSPASTPGVSAYSKQ